MLPIGHSPPKDFVSRYMEFSLLSMIGIVFCPVIIALLISMLPFWAIGKLLGPPALRLLEWAISKEKSVGGPTHGDYPGP